MVIIIDRSSSPMILAMIMLIITITMTCPVYFLKIKCWACCLAGWACCLQSIYMTGKKLSNTSETRLGKAWVWCTGCWQLGSHTRQQIYIYFDFPLNARSRISMIYSQFTLFVDFRSIIKRCASSYFLLIDWLFKVNLVRLMAHSSRIVAQGLWLIAKKKRKLVRGTLVCGGGGRPSLFFVGHEPWSLSYEPWAISHEPRTVNSRRVLSNRW